MRPKGAMERQLREGARKLPGVEVTDEQIRVLCAYCGLLERWSRAYNLVGPRTLPEIVPRHILDSLALSSFLPPRAARLLDLGTGAGLPGFPLAVAHPNRRFTLLDRSRKKTRFARQAKLELGVANVEVVTADAADYRGGPFDCLLARAVGTLAELARCGAHLLAPGGIFLLPKGPGVEREARELPPGWSAQVESAAAAGTVVVLRPPGPGPEGP